MFSRPTSLSVPVAKPADMAPALAVADRSDLLGSSLMSGPSSYLAGDELNEEDLWNDDSAVDEPRAEEAVDVVAPKAEIPVSKPSRVSVVSRLDTSSLVHDNSRSRPKGLSLLTQQLNATNPGGISGDIVKISTGVTPSVVIPRLAAVRDTARPLRRASAPVNVPDWSRMVGSKPQIVEVQLDEEEAPGMIPPHELVARQYAQSVTFSVLEGVGRTLRGRDLDHVRTEVLRKTGFIDN